VTDVRRNRSTGRGALAFVLVAAGVAVAGVGGAILALLITIAGGSGGCPQNPAGASVMIGPPGTGQLVGATEYGGPGDPSSGEVGASGANLLTHPDSYAELGGLTFQTATAMGGLPYMTPLRITWGRRSAIAYKRDFGFGGGPVAGFPRVIDLWWRFSTALGIPYERGQWSGPVRIGRPPAGGAANLLGQTVAPPGSPLALTGLSPDPGACSPGALAGVPLTPGASARLPANRRPGVPRCGRPVAPPRRHCFHGWRLNRRYGCDCRELDRTGVADQAAALPRRKYRGRSQSRDRGGDG